MGARFGLHFARRLADRAANCTASGSASRTWSLFSVCKSTWSSPAFRARARWGCVGEQPSRSGWTKANRDAHDPEVRRSWPCALPGWSGLATELHPLSGMEPYRPPDPPLWPVPHWPIFDFEATAAGAEWIDEIAAEARTVRDPNAKKIVIGHGDWSVKHFRFDGLRPTVIYDWDSLNADFEAVFVGGAARSFTYRENTTEPWPSLDEIFAFFDEYQAARRGLHS